MLCLKPFMRGRIPFGCGQCNPCRLNRRRQWTWRQYLESLTHDSSSFVTLTYDDEHLPKPPSLDPRVLQLWLKKVRFNFGEYRIRFFGVGEYGEGGTRAINPHYHISLFGLPPSALLASATKTDPRDPRRVWIPSWPNGAAFVAEFNELTAQYISGYVVKKLTKADDVRLPPGLHPEFARMSRRPGIGRDAMHVVASTLSQSGSLDLIPGGDVPKELKLGRRSIPLGRYLLQSLRTSIGFTDEYIALLKEKGSYEQSVELSSLLQAALSASPSEAVTPRSAFLESIRQKLLQSEARAKIWRKNETL